MLHRRKELILAGRDYAEENAIFHEMSTIPHRLPRTVAYAFRFCIFRAPAQHFNEANHLCKTEGGYGSALNVDSDSSYITVGILGYTEFSERQSLRVRDKRIACVKR